MERFLTLDPEKRVTARDALDSDYFWEEPLPCKPGDLPKYEPSHEFQTRKRKQNKTKTVSPYTFNTSTSHVIANWNNNSGSEHRINIFV